MALALDVFEDLVISADFLLVFCQDAVHSIDRCVSDELFELWHVDEVGNVTIEHHIISHADAILVIPVVLALADAVGQAPGGARAAIRLAHLLLLRLSNALVPTHIHERLLVEERLLLVADHLFGERLDTKAAIGLDQSSADWQLTALFHLT
eukprot:CAMPEP_0185569334 /NCGR_PEP_ID=MMETSP0434-20130131/1983_1 /TAXON_ID=626734 ORGANISM="Favella taraikaensis, Strain Fe Narragansett Bay" /NCGR_SAMPLE_ID=MMETSP0434 /ASSEMBLY_ACC=CAM_ASM_000379 /LENGTH=151 /DNA_ID=CAMNT_0028184085 /DNA_START=1927 /DNA_END=2382 /DNA_ORIENTATION=+